MGVARIGIVLLVLATAGCGVPTPQPTQTPTPTITESPTPTPSVTAESIVFDATSLVVTNSDDSSETIEYDQDPDAIIALLSDALGEPVTTQVDTEHCSPAHTEVDWGEAVALSWGEGFFYIPVGQSVTMVVSEPTMGDVELTAPHGVAVGDPIDVLSDFEGWPYRQSAEFEGSTYESVIVAHGGGDLAGLDAWGVVADTVDGTIVSLRAPAILAVDC